MAMVSLLTPFLAAAMVTLSLLVSKSYGMSPYVDCVDCRVSLGPGWQADGSVTNITSPPRAFPSPSVPLPLPERCGKNSAPHPAPLPDTPLERPDVVFNGDSDLENSNDSDGDRDRDPGSDREDPGADPHGDPGGDAGGDPGGDPGGDAGGGGDPGGHPPNYPGGDPGGDPPNDPAGDPPDDPEPVPVPEARWFSFAKEMLEAGERVCRYWEEAKEKQRRKSWECYLKKKTKEIEKELKKLQKSRIVHNYHQYCYHTEDKRSTH